MIPKNWKVAITSRPDKDPSFLEDTKTYLVKGTFEEALSKALAMVEGRYITLLHIEPTYMEVLL